MFGNPSDISCGLGPRTKGIKIDSLNGPINQVNN